ncbi:MAG TPA: aldo/keto reductase [Actinomycetota bacterium]|jgi:aryl-alcohol dehydrogenase-like predicted oxidoreductase|nr:aldo/keto reductase [Actinomycetota bacterium]
MERRPLGATGLSVTPIGLGLAALGRPAYIDLGRADDLGEPDDRSIEAMRTRAHAVLDAAFDLGVRYFDAARSYGLAEEFLGSWLEVRRLDRDDVTVGSKWGYTYVGDWRIDAEVHEVKDHTVSTLRRQIEESREWLGDRLALYQIHSATLESAVLDDSEVLDELTSLHEEHGLVIGITTSGPRQAETIRRALEVGGSGAAPFVAVQATWNLLETSAGPALADAHDAGWGILVKEAMANGRLGPRGTGSHKRVVDAVAEHHGVGPDAVALGSVLAQPWADVVLSGAVNEAQVSSNLEAHDVELSDADLAELGAITEAPDLYWERRSRLAWS